MPHNDIGYSAGIVRVPARSLGSTQGRRADRGRLCNTPYPVASWVPRARPQVRESLYEHLFGLLTVLVVLPALAIGVLLALPLLLIRSLKPND
jgi:hypothetical protein